MPDNSQPTFRYPTGREAGGITLAVLAVLSLWALFGDFLSSLLVRAVEIATSLLDQRFPGVLTFFGTNAALIGGGLLALLLLRIGVGQARGSRPPTIRPITPRLIVIGVGIVGAAAWGITSWLTGIANFPGSTPQAAASLRLDAIRTGLSAAGGIGALLALILAARRQWSNEVGTNATVVDAEERRHLDSYTRAVEQLGSSEESIRLGGIHALERLAASSTSYRETVINMLCSYIRSPEEFKSEPEVARSKNPKRRLGLQRSDTSQPKDRHANSRLAAQRTLERRIRYHATEIENGSRYWPELSIDLEGATLTDLNFTNARLVELRCNGATFYGDSSFINLKCRRAIFDHAKFRGSSNFSRSSFQREASFFRVRFSDIAIFRRVSFGRRADFRLTSWYGLSEFSWSTVGPWQLRLLFLIPPLWPLARKVIDRLGGREYSRSKENVFAGQENREGASIAFTGARFLETEARFDGIIVLGHVNFQDTRFADHDFRGAYWWNRDSDFLDSTFSDRATISIPPPGWDFFTDGNVRTLQRMILPLPETGSHILKRTK